MASLAVSERKTAAADAATIPPTTFIPSAATGSMIPTDLSEEKRQKMTQLCDRLGDELPVPGRTDLLTLYRFCVARDWDLDETEKMLRAHVQWRADAFPIPRSYWEKDPLFLNGAIFPHGRDKVGRPIIVVRSGLFCPNERDLDKCIKAAISCCMDLFMKQGCFSKVTIVYDRQNFSMSQHLDKPLLKELASLFSDNFPESLHAAYLYPCGFVLRGIWAVVQYFFDVKTRSKVFMLADPESFKEHIDASQLISAVGGTSDYVFDIDAFTEAMPQIVVDPWVEKAPGEGVAGEPSVVAAGEGVGGVNDGSGEAAGESKDT